MTTHQLEVRRTGKDGTTRKKPDPAQLRQLLAKYHELRLDARDEARSVLGVLTFDFGLNRIEYDGVVATMRRPGEKSGEPISQRISEWISNRKFGFVASLCTGFMPQVLALGFGIYLGVKLAIREITTPVKIRDVQRQLILMGEDCTIPQADEHKT